MNILCIGDIVGRPGREVLTKVLPSLKQELVIDCCVANAENASGGSGLIPKNAKEILEAGVDIMTLGDHVWDKPEVVSLLQGECPLVRPYNFPPGAPGAGYKVLKMNNGHDVAVINLLGRTFMKYNVDCPFRAIDVILNELPRAVKIIIVDFHAETTSEKVAFSYYVDGRVSAVVGTHTHVATADERILSKGTAAITDLGMTGPLDSVIGQDKEKIIKRFLTGLPQKFEVAQSLAVLRGVSINIDPVSGQAVSINRIERTA